MLFLDLLLFYHINEIHRTLYLNVSMPIETEFRFFTTNVIDLKDMELVKVPRNLYANHIAIFAITSLSQIQNITFFNFDMRFQITKENLCI